METRLRDGEAIRSRPFRVARPAKTRHFARFRSPVTKPNETAWLHPVLATEFRIVSTASSCVCRWSLSVHSSLLTAHTAVEKAGAARLGVTSVPGRGDAQSTRRFATGFISGETAADPAISRHALPGGLRMFMPIADARRVLSPSRTAGTVAGSLVLPSCCPFLPDSCPAKACHWLPSRLRRTRSLSFPPCPLPTAGQEAPPCNDNRTPGSPCEPGGGPGLIKGVSRPSRPLGDAMACGCVHGEEGGYAHVSLSRGPPSCRGHVVDAPDGLETAGVECHPS